MDQVWLLPSLLEVAAVLAVVVLVALLAHIALRVLVISNAPVAPVRVRSRERAQDDYWAPDAPGRPQPRAPDCGPYFD